MKKHKKYTAIYDPQDNSGEVATMHLLAPDAIQAIAEFTRISRAVSSGFNLFAIIEGHHKNLYTNETTKPTPLILHIDDPKKVLFLAGAVQMFSDYVIGLRNELKGPALKKLKNTGFIDTAESWIRSDIKTELPSFLKPRPHHD